MFIERCTGGGRGHAAAVRYKDDEVSRTGPPKAPFEPADKMVIDNAGTVGYFITQNLVDHRCGFASHREFCLVVIRIEYGGGFHIDYFRR